MVILWPKFVEIDGCVLLEEGSDEVQNLDMDWIAQTFGNKTGFEASNNHIHMMDYIADFEDNHKAGLRFALALSEIWECKLKRDFPNYMFHLILTYDGEDSILRFYRVRPKEEAWLDLNSLEEYEDTAILFRVIG